MDSNENCGKNSTLKNPAAYGPVLISKCHNFCNFWQIAKRSDSLYEYDALYKVWTNETWERSRVLKTVKLETLQSAPNDPKPNSRNRASIVPYLCAMYYPESQISIRFALRSAVFKILHMLGFPIESHVKISTCHKLFKFWQMVNMP